MTRSELYLACMWSCDIGRSFRGKDYEELVEEWKAANANWSEQIEEYEKEYAKQKR